MRAAAVCSVCEGALGTSPGHWGYRACHSCLSGGAGVCIRPYCAPTPRPAQRQAPRPSRMPLLLLTLGQREARGGAVVLLGGHQPQSRGSEPASQDCRPAGEWTPPPPIAPHACTPPAPRVSSVLPPQGLSLQTSRCLWSLCPDQARLAVLPCTLGREEREGAQPWGDHP